MEEYLKDVLEQIRCKKAHVYVEQELRDHLENQISDNISSGMEKSKAIAEAVRDMGDPIETGVMLDRVHRPQIAWKMIFLVGIISMLGLLIHVLICIQLPAEVTGYEHIVYSSKNYMKYMFMGLFVMTGLYWIDYTIIARYARVIAGALILVALFTLMFGETIYGATYWLNICGISVSAKSFMILYVPIYAGVLYKYYGKGYKGLCLSIVWMAVPVFLVLRMPALVTAFTMMTSMLVMLTIAVIKGWFHVHKKMVIVTLWGILPIGVLTGGYLIKGINSYQLMRIKAFLSANREVSYLTYIVRENFLNLKLIGNSGMDITERIPNFNSDYLLTYISSAYGLLAGLLICLAAATIIFYVFWFSRKQKNQLGMMMESGCGMVFLINLVVNIGVNAGAVPPTSTSFPFLSAGGGNIIISYALIGIVLSVYRFKNVYPHHMNINLRKKRKINISNG